MRALRSLLAQHDPDWLAVAVGEGFVPSLPLEARYYSVKTAHGRDGLAGLLNQGMRHVRLAASLGQINPEWIGFLDSSDTVSERYVSRLMEVGEGVEVVVFRAVGAGGDIYPHPLYPALAPGDVDLSFAVRRSFADHFNIEFGAVADVPHFFLRQCMSLGARILLHPDISYFVEDQRP